MRHPYSWHLHSHRPHSREVKRAAGAAGQITPVDDALAVRVLVVVEHAIGVLAAAQVWKVWKVWEAARTSGEGQEKWGGGGGSGCR
eukprot:364071-Chlamydomonas_euryale.AAC.10